MSIRQDLTTDSAERYIEASPEVLYAILSDVTRTPERTPDVVKCEWIDGATGPAVGARFKSLNTVGHGPKWNNKSTVTVADPGKEFSFARKEFMGGVLEWRHQLVAEGSGTRVIESYEVTKPLALGGWFIIGVVFGMKDRQTDLQESMQQSLGILAGLAEAEEPATA
jgi:hypothetical protein